MPKTMSDAALAANRANARKSTGPRTPAGKARSASNSFKHGLYAPHRFQLWSQDSNPTHSLAVNLIAEYEPVTPTEHLLVQQLIHHQLRLLQIQGIYNAMMDEVIDEQNDPAEGLPADSATRYARAFTQLADDSRALSLALRELDRLPVKIRKTIASLHELQSLRNDETEIETIPEPHLFPDPGKSLKAETNPSAEDEGDEADPLQDPPAMSKRWITDRFADYLFQNHPEERYLYYGDNDPLLKKQTTNTEPLSIEPQQAA